MSIERGAALPIVRAARGVPGQIAFVVADIRQAIEEWGVHEGRPEWRLWTYGPLMCRDQSYRGAPSDYSMLLAVNGAGPQLELVQPLTGPSIYSEWLDEGRTGVHHLGYYVDDLDTVVEQMARAGYPAVQTGAGYGADGSGSYAYWDLRAELGIYLEGIQVPTVRREPEWRYPQIGEAR